MHRAEAEETVPCPICGGDGGGDDGLGGRWSWIVCRTCRGTGRTEAADAQVDLDRRCGDEETD